MNLSKIPNQNNPIWSTCVKWGFINGTVLGISQIPLSNKLAEQLPLMLESNYTPQSNGWNTALLAIWGIYCFYYCVKEYFQKIESPTVPVGMKAIFLSAGFSVVAFSIFFGGYLQFIDDSFIVAIKEYIAGSLSKENVPDIQKEQTLSMLDYFCGPVFLSLISAIPLKLVGALFFGFPIVRHLVQKNTNND